MNLEEARLVLETTASLGSDVDARRTAGLTILDGDPSPRAIEAVLDAVEGGGRRMAIPDGSVMAIVIVPRLLVADVLISNVLRHHPRADIVPTVAGRLARLREMQAWREREQFAVYMVEALSFLLARRALQEHRAVIEELWLYELGASGRALAQKWGDDALRARLGSVD